MKRRFPNVAVGGTLVLTLAVADLLGCWGIPGSHVTFAPHAPARLSVHIYEAGSPVKTIPQAERPRLALLLNDWFDQHPTGWHADYNSYAPDLLVLGEGGFSLNLWSGGVVVNSGMKQAKHILSPAEAADLRRAILETIQ
jgi:hypothetical protein